MGQMPRDQKKRDVPDGLWMKCPGCEETVFRKRVEEELMVCPDCEYHFAISADVRIGMLLDKGSFEEWFSDMEPMDPLEFKDIQLYKDRLAKYQAATGLKDAVVCGKGRIGGREVVMLVMDNRFMMASMGSVVGEKFARCVEAAGKMNAPFIAVCASGGARMQEGMLSLMQMAKTSAVVGLYKKAGGLYISVMTNPTTAGVMASFASLGDVIIAEPGALIGFTGPRVIKETIKAELPEGFQSSEFLLEHGFVDRIVPRKELKDEIASVMEYCKGPIKPRKPVRAKAAQ
jgi:acetyl-CoA carboxylase carboxyl transferase subunit beta